MRRKFAAACLRPFLLGLVTMVGIAGVVAAGLAIGSGQALMMIAAVSGIALGTSLLFGLPALAAAMAIAFVGGRHIIAHPAAFALICVGLAPLVLAVSRFPPTSATLGLALATLPGASVAFLLLYASFDRIAAEHRSAGTANCGDA